MPDGRVVLIDYKDGYDGFLNANGSGLADWVTRSPNARIEDQLIDQAKRQVAAASGNPVEWRCSNHQFTDYLNNLFREERINGIRAVFTPKK